MIEGIGIDLVSIRKIKKALHSHGERFYSRVFSEKERNVIEKIKCRNELKAMQKAAGYFAVKEAFLKSIGAGIFSLPLNKIATSNEESGQPLINIDEDTAYVINQKFKKALFSIKVSITHENDFACAIVVIQSLNKK